MRVVIGLDWSDQSFAAVAQTFQLYHPTDVALVNGVELGILEHPFLAQAGEVQGHDAFRNAMVDSGRQVLERAAAMVPADIQSIRKISEIGSPAPLILDSANNLSADLVAIGSRGQSRLSEIVLGSVSHRVLLHNSKPTLIVKGAARTVQRVLIGIEDKEDADQIVKWLTQHPFVNPVELRVLHAVVPIGVMEPYVGPEIGAWLKDVQCYAEELVQATAAKLQRADYKVTTAVIQGNPTTVIEQEAKDMDLVVVTSHGRTGLSRFLLGSVSHAVVHHVTCPVLVLR